VSGREGAYLQRACETEQEQRSEGENLCEKMRKKIDKVKYHSIRKADADNRTVFF
jgi:hypothetical protein